MPELSSDALADDPAHERARRARAFYEELTARIPDLMSAWAAALLEARCSDMGAVHSKTMRELEETVWNVWVRQRTQLRIINDVMYLFPEHEECDVFRYNVCSVVFRNDSFANICEGAFWTVHATDTGTAGDRESYTLTNFKYDASAPRYELAHAALRAFYDHVLRHATLTDEYTQFFLAQTRAVLRERIEVCSASASASEGGNPLDPEAELASRLANQLLRELA